MLFRSCFFCMCAFVHLLLRCVFCDVCLSFVFFFWDPYHLNVGAFNVVPEVSETVSILFILFSLLCSAVVFSTILSYRSLIRSSASVILLLIPSREFFISFIVFFIIVYLLFSSSRSLLNIFLYFLHSISKILDHLYYHYSEFFPGRLSISSSFVWSGRFLPCSFICCIFLCLLILLNLLCLGGLLFPGCRFVVSVVFGVCPQWVRLVQWVV